LIVFGETRGAAFAPSSRQVKPKVRTMTQVAEKPPLDHALSAAGTAPVATPVVPNGGRMTFEEFLAWADEDTNAEWVDGEVIFMSPASDPHQDLADFLVTLVRLWVEARQSGWVRSNPFLMRLASRPSGREPDLVYVAEENRSRLRNAYVDGPADLVVEIVSPESQQRDRVDKLREYEQGGVREYWLIDRAQRQAGFYQLGPDSKYYPATVGADGIYHSAVIEGLWIKVEWLWQDPLPRIMDVLKEWKLI